MRITKRQLRRIIKEEKRKLLREGNQESAMYDRRAKEQGYGPTPRKGGGTAQQEFTRILGSINDLVDEALRLGINPEELRSELEGIAESVNNLDNQQGW